MGAIGEDMLNVSFMLQNWELKDFSDVSKLTKLEKNLRSLLNSVSLHLGAEAAADTEVTVEMQWGFRYRISDQHEYTRVAECTQARAIEMAKELKEYNGDVTVEIMRRMTMASEWKAQDIAELAQKVVS